MFLRFVFHYVCKQAFLISFNSVKEKKSLKGNIDFGEWFFKQWEDSDYMPLVPRTVQVEATNVNSHNAYWHYDVSDP